MNISSNENIGAPSNFVDRLQQARKEQQVDPAIPDLQQWMQYWNDEESETANLRNIRHWLSRMPHCN